MSRHNYSFSTNTMTETNKLSHQTGVGDGQPGEIDGRGIDFIAGTVAPAQHTQTAGAGEA